MYDVFDFWEQVLHRLDGVTEDQKKWLMAHVLPVAITDLELVLQVQKSFLKYWLEENLLAQLQQAVNQFLPLQIRIDVADMPPVSPAPPTATVPPVPPVQVSPVQTPPVTVPEKPLTFEVPDLAHFQVTENYQPPTPKIPIFEIPQPRYNAPATMEPVKKDNWLGIPVDMSFTFDNFIVGNCNRMAMAAASSVAENPAQNQNPLFIYGPSGLGKTHLMHAIRNYVLIHHPEKKIVFLSSEDFMRNFINVIQQKNNESSEAFRDKYRSVDYILIDDIQFLDFGKKESTLIEIFHTFNELLNYKKQIVLTSDRLPSDMVKLESRLRSRFESGLVVEIQPSDFEMRCAFLQRTSEEKGLDMPFNAVQFIAETFDDNFRTLDGYINTILKDYELNPQPITLERVRNLLASRIPKDANRFLTSDMIIAGVCDHYRVRRQKLIGKSRPKNIAFPRQVAMYLCREMLNLSYGEIGNIFDRDHTTVLYAYEKIYNELQKRSNPEMIEDIERLKKEIDPYSG